MANKNLIFVHGMGEGNHDEAYENLYKNIEASYDSTQNKIKPFKNLYSKRFIEWSKGTNLLQKVMFDKAFVQNKHYSDKNVKYFPEPFGKWLSEGIEVRDRLKSFIHFYFGDAVAYTTKKDNKIRSKVIEELEPFVNDQFSIIAHSLGSVIVSDILLHTKFWVNNPSELSQDDFDFYKTKLNIDFNTFAHNVQQNLQHFFTIGSNISLFLQQDLLTFGAVPAIDAEHPILNHQLWVNFFDVNDFLAYPVKPFFDNNNTHKNIQDVPVSCGNTFSSHGGYWENQYTAEIISRYL